MRRLPILVALLAGLLMPSLGHAAVSVADLRANDVVFDAGVNRPAADRERLQSAADELRGKSFPTKFVVVARAPKNIDALAATLRRGLAKQVGIDNIDAVLVLAPHQLGVNADVFETERATAVQEALPTLKTDEIAGTILLANRLQQFDEAGALPGDVTSTSKGGGLSGWVIAALVVAGLAVLVGAVLARRASKRAAARNVTDEPAPPVDG